ncbi:allantoin permease [Lichtheimia corymbifera JMRC:FSU:9682]|uniref:Allantoin permease n=1 Tax=Lichtheimia corymbifera JMRC:FSU:9682 TaxID=1263082 RepID=A0A068RL27_9FUNG|nr:allantoin permease [Lichtheimia corymbifera JMRC:FSU:9682]
MTTPQHKNDSEEKHVVYTEDASQQPHSLSSGDQEQQQPGKVIKSPEELAYIRKLNITVLPLMMAIIFVQFCDKAALSVGPVLGLNHDLGLTGTEFSVLGAVFYAGFFVFQIPNQFILQHVPHAKYMSALLVVWGIVMLLSGLANNFSQMAACRFLLGLFEAAAMPTLYLITATLYRRSEQTLVFGFVTLSNGVGAAFGASTAYGFSHMNNARGITNWRWGSFIYGALTILVGLVCFFFLADRPDHPLLRPTEKEKQIIEERKQDNAVVRHRIIKYYQIKESLKEWRYWFLVLGAFCINLQNGGMLVFSTTFVLGLGFDPQTSLLLQIPSGMASALGVVVAVLLARVTKQMIYSAMAMMLVGIAGLVILIAIPDGEIKLLGYYLSWAGTGSYALLLTIVGNNCKGLTKKIFYNSSVMVAYTIGNLVGPLMMAENTAPRYIGGISGFLGGFVIAFLCYAAIRVQGARVNRRRLANKTGEETNLELDLTDKEDENFIYRL